MKKLLIIIPLLLGLNACIKDTKPGDDDLLQERNKRLASITKWDIWGKTSININGESGTVTLEWQQIDDNYKINIIAPMGKGQWVIEGKDGEVTLKTSKGETFKGSSPEDLLNKNAGIDVPIQNLKYWVKGGVSPESQYEARTDGDARIEVLEQDGWKIEFRRYTKVDGEYLPVKIFIESQEKDIEVRMAIKKWQINNE